SSGASGTACANGFRLARPRFDSKRSATVNPARDTRCRVPNTKPRQRGALHSRFLVRKFETCATVRSTMSITSINPATGEKLKEFSAFDENEIEKRLQRAARAFEHHRREPFAKRAQLFMAAGSFLEQGKEEFARTITLEMGKLLRGRVGEIMKFARVWRFCAEYA